jgi:hypothetical protein
MRWRVDHANAIFALGCRQLSGGEHGASPRNTRKDPQQRRVP